MVDRHTDRRKLERLRLALARVAQVAGVETDALPVLNKGYDDLVRMTEEREYGWVVLAGVIAEAIEIERMYNYGGVYSVD